MNIGADAIRNKYTGRVAECYDDERSWEPKWEAEAAAMARFLATIGGGNVLDIPVGTGRFLADYKRHGMRAIGLDISADMLAQAQMKMPDADLREGDILSIPLPGYCVDAAIAVRILNWLTVEEVRAALAELSRVTRQWIITSGGRSNERSAIVRNLAGFVPVDETLIETNIRGDYSLVLLRRMS